MRELTERGVTVEFVRNKLTFAGGKADPMAKLMLTMLAGFAAFERDLIRERQREGIALAKAKGVYKGRKEGFDARRGQGTTRAGACGHPQGRPRSGLWNQPGDPVSVPQACRDT